MASSAAEGPASPVFGSPRVSRRRALRERIRFLAKALLKPASETPMHLLSASPIVLYVHDRALQPGATCFRLLRALARRRVDVLLCPTWNMDHRRMVEGLLLLERRLRRGGDHRLTLLAATEREHARLRGAGLESIHFSSNAASDERLYRPIPGRQVRFDAVYDANLSPFKRHLLAAQVPRLSLLTYLIEGRIDPAYRRAVDGLLARSHVWNGDPLSAAYRWLGPVEVNAALNACAVGLCLSAEEGSMYASIQYLLAGLPVVSTESEGGRDEFFHPDYVRIVEATPEAVATGVAEMRRCQVAPREIRERTLARMIQHRRRLFACVDRIFASQGVERRFEAEWPAVFVDKLRDPAEDPTGRILAAIEAAQPQAGG